mgnify:CR=1 FL=1
MDQIATRWCLSERPFRNLPNGILRKFLRGLSQFPLSSSANSRRVPRSFGKTLRDLSHPLMGNKRILCSLDARSQGAKPPRPLRE